MRALLLLAVLGCGGPALQNVPHPNNAAMGAGFAAAAAAATLASPADAQKHAEEKGKGDPAGKQPVNVKEQVQPPLSQSTDPEWAQAMVKRTAATMAASTFDAVVNSKCRNCPVRTSCPVGGKGRQVTDETGHPRPAPLSREAD